MDSVADIPEVQLAFSPGHDNRPVDKPLFIVDKWSVNEMRMSYEKFLLLWQMLQRYPTLFSDLTRGDQENFLNTVSAPHTMWFEVRTHGVLIGIIWFGEMHQITDCLAHLVFFDRQPAEKVHVCKHMVKWMFKNFPLQRISVTPPEVYHGTVRLVRQIGFVKEGIRRKSALLGNRWKDQALFGITREEAEAL
jgi:hypothetical protein